MADYKEYVHAVYQEKSFSNAAKKLFVSQPWLSATVKKVEQEIGFPIFNRSTNPISLTEEGRYYIRLIEQIMALEKEMAQHFKELREGQNLRLHIGSSMFFCTYVLPSLLAEFQAQYPQAVLSFTEGTTANLAKRLLDGKLDFFLEAEDPADPQITTQSWATEEIVLAVPAQNPLNQELRPYAYSFTDFLQREKPQVKRPPVPLRAFQNESFLMLKSGHDIHTRSVTLCRNAGFNPKVSMYLAQMMTAYYLVCEGQGITFLRSTIPEYVTPTDSVVFYQLEDPAALRTIYLSYLSQGTSTLGRKLIDYVWSRNLLGK